MRFALGRARRHGIPLGISIKISLSAESDQGLSPTPTNLRIRQGPRGRPEPSHARLLDLARYYMACAGQITGSEYCIHYLQTGNHRFGSFISEKIFTADQ